MAKNKVVIGIVDAQVQAENIVQRLQREGFPTADISAIFPDKHGGKDSLMSTTPKRPKAR